MSKIEEYNQAKKEFDTWFYHEAQKVLATATAGNQVVKSREQHYQDLQTLNQVLHAFVGKYQLFSGNLYSTETINLKIKSERDLYFTVSNNVCGCSIYFEPNGKPKNKIEMFFYCGQYMFSYNISKCFDNVVYPYLDLLASVLKKCNLLSELQKEAKEEENEQREEQIKQDRIKLLQSNSSEEWISSLLKNTAYPYKIVKGHDNKLLLHVKMNGKQHLEIPIYYKSFQKIVPQLLETIQQYENVVKNGQIRVLVKNSSPGDCSQWLNN